MATLDQIFQQNSYNLKDAVSKSARWFDQQARLLSQKTINPARLIRSNPELSVTAIVPGEMYLFQYDAKFKDTLPIWDKYPLVFPFKKLSDGFIGLNMHYLPYYARIKLLNKLMVFRNNSTLDHQTRLKLSWSLINGVSALRVAEPCVHRYLSSHVKSPFKRIEAQHWATAMMLPVEGFVGGTKQQAWKK